MLLAIIMLMPLGLAETSVNSSTLSRFMKTGWTEPQTIDPHFSMARLGCNSVLLLLFGVCAVVNNSCLNAKHVYRIHCKVNVVFDQELIHAVARTHQWEGRL